MLLQVMFLAVPEGAGNQHDNISKDLSGIHYTITKMSVSDYGNTLFKESVLITNLYRHVKGTMRL